MFFNPGTLRPSPKEYSFSLSAKNRELIPALIKNRLFKEFITWYFGAYLDQSRTLDKTAKAHWFNRLNHELENDFEATINQFLKDNYTEKE